MKRVVSVEGVNVLLVRHQRPYGPRGGLMTLWDAYLEGGVDTPLTLGDASPTRADLLGWLHSSEGRRMVRECSPRQAS